MTIPFRRRMILKYSLRLMSYSPIPQSSILFNQIFDQQGIDGRIHQEGKNL